MISNLDEADRHATHQDDTCTQTGNKHQLLVHSSMTDKQIELPHSAEPYMSDNMQINIPI